MGKNSGYPGPVCEKFLSDPQKQVLYQLKRVQKNLFLIELRPELLVNNISVMSGLLLERGRERETEE